MESINFKWQLKLTNDNKDDDLHSNQSGKARHFMHTRVLHTSADSIFPLSFVLYHPHFVDKNGSL
jgi:hypothetical protein